MSVSYGVKSCYHPHTISTHNNRLFKFKNYLNNKSVYVIISKSSYKYAVEYDTLCYMSNTELIEQMKRRAIELIESGSTGIAMDVLQAMGALREWEILNESR